MAHAVEDRMRYDSKDMILAGALGWLCGMRSMAGPALVARRLVRNDQVVAALGIGAIGEMLVDKHPATPNRTDPPSVMARTMSGAVTGAAVVVSGAGWSRRVPMRSRRASWPMSTGDTAAAAIAGAVIGGGAAFIGTHVSYHMRRFAAAQTQAPNVVLGVAEDAIVYGAGIALSNEL
jgi:hypothetical protein